VSGAEASNVQPSPGSYNLDGPFIQAILKRERAKVSGMEDEDRT